MRRALVVLAVILLAGAAFLFFGTSDEVDVTRTLLEGRWVSTEDARFSRSISPDGGVVEVYEGSPEITGYWALFTKDMPAHEVPHELEEGLVYLAVGIPENPTLYYQVAAIDESRLDLIHLERGNTLSFTKVK